MNIQHLFPRLLIALSAMAAGAQPLPALDDKRKQEIYATVGRDTGRALLSTHEAINVLAGRWAKQGIAQAEAGELAASYQNSAKLCAKLLQGKSLPLSKAAQSLVEQAVALETWIKAGPSASGKTFAAFQTETNTLLEGGTSAAPPEMAGDGAGAKQINGPAVGEVRAIAEKLRLNLGNALAWKPTAEQCAAIVATPEDAAKLATYAEAVYAELAAGKPAAKADQTEIRVTGPDWKELPGGYTQQRAHFSDGVEVYGFKYLEPGKDAGMSYDGLFKVDGKWVFIPKAWRAFRKPSA